MEIASFMYRNKSYNFDIRLLPTVFCALFLLLFIILGGWQYQRYHWKQDLLTNYHQRLSKPPVSLSFNSEPQAFQTVSVRGHYVGETLLLDNRTRDGVAGYEVLMPFKPLDSNRVVLINRGWLAKAQIESQPELLKPKTTPQTLQGYVKTPPKHVFMLGDTIPEPNKRPLVIQKIDLQQLHEQTTLDYLPFVLRLQPQAKSPFKRDWEIVTLSPAQHLGYSVQWFGMAVALLIAYCCLSITRVKSDGN
ncbi:MAG: hypothetical protein CMF50_04300 [Legionellales bacterium]|nr:hypothetical protein [Legionellales bacterium]